MQGDAIDNYYHADFPLLYLASYCRQQFAKLKVAYMTALQNQFDAGYYNSV